MSKSGRIEWSLGTQMAKQFTAALRLGKEPTIEEYRAATLEALALLENLVKDNTPVGATSLLRGAWAHELLGGPDDGRVTGRLYNPLGYAAPMEYGTKPHWAPLDPLVDWVKAKLDVKDDDEAMEVAKKIQFKIAAHGTKGAHMAQRGLEDALSDIIKMYKAAQVRALARIKAN